MADKLYSTIRVKLSEIYDFVRKEKNVITAAAVVIIFYMIMEAIGITCPILFVTGVSCAGCGMSRAWLSLLRFDFTSAFYYHPLFWLPPVCVILYFLRNHFSPALRKGIMISVVVLMLVVYMFRMINPNDSIVVFHPQNGIVFRVLSYFGI